MISGQMRAQNDASMIFTGKIDLNNMINPAFSFYTFNIVGHRNNSIQNDLNEIDVKIREVGTEEWTLLKHGSVNELCGGDTAVWKKISVNLAAYKGKMVQVGLQATCKNFVWMLFDRLELTEDLGHNLKPMAITAPMFAKPNEEFNINVNVKNLGSQEATDYSVEFYRGDATTPFATVNGSPLASEMDTIFTAPYKLTFADEDANVTFKAVVKYNADENQSDNTSETVTVTRKYSQKPAPKNLKGKHEGGNIMLSWTAPDVPSTQQRMATDVSDDLESYTSWTDSLVGGWTFVDKDQGPRGGFKGMTIPNVPLKSKGSWFVFKQGGDFNMSYHAHSGTQFFASLFNYDISQVDDWCISPELSGYAQTMKFWARSYSTDYLEKMEVLYSTTDKNPDHFTSRGIVDGVPGEWTEFNCELPAGTKYFAIRNCGTDKFMLMLDDFTFESAGVTLVGYNIYRDNVKVNSEVIPATTTNYLVPSITGTHTYHVTAIYSSGDESAPAGTTLGVEDIDASVNVIAGHGTISVLGAEGKQVTIVGTNGITFFNNVAKNDIVVKVLPGVYMVRVADDNYKIVVK